MIDKNKIKMLNLLKEIGELIIVPVSFDGFLTEAVEGYIKQSHVIHLSRE